MNKRYLIIIEFIYVILFSNCIHYKRTGFYDPSKEQFIRQMGLMYEKNIIDFFPSDDSNYIADNQWGSYYSSSWEDSDECIFRCCAYFSKKVSAATIDSIEEADYIERVKYNESLFTIDVPYMKYPESYRNSMKDSLQIPIASMRYSFFNIGETIDTIIIENRQYIEKNEVIPNDLVVYVFEAQNGNYWKNKLKASKEERPVLSDYWKHGYVKGIAVSRSLFRVCWWAMAW